LNPHIIAGAFLRISRFPLAVAVIAVVVTGCATPAPPASEPPPKIGAVTTVGGKGFPNGRSDSTDRFLPLDEVSSDSTYGYRQSNPVKVGTGNLATGSRSEQLFLNGLRGPNGEAIEYERIGSCCPFKTSSVPTATGNGLLDVYRITYPGQTQAITLYLNMYDRGTLTAPAGFTIRQRR